MPYISSSLFLGHRVAFEATLNLLMSFSTNTLGENRVASKVTLPQVDDLESPRFLEENWVTSEATLAEHTSFKAPSYLGENLVTLEATLPRANKF